MWPSGKGTALSMRRFAGSSPVVSARTQPTGTRRYLGCEGDGNPPDLGSGATAFDSRASDQTPVRTWPVGTARWSSGMDSRPSTGRRGFDPRTRYRNPDTGPGGRGEVLGCQALPAARSAETREGQVQLLGQPRERRPTAGRVRASHSMRDSRRSLHVAVLAQPAEAPGREPGQSGFDSPAPHSFRASQAHLAEQPPRKRKERGSTPRRGSAPL